MNTILILKSLYKINSAAKTLAVLKQDAYDSGSHRMCAMYKIEQNRLYTLKTLVIQQLVSDGVLKRSKSVLDYKGGLLSEFATEEGDFCFHSVMEHEEIKDTKNLAVYRKSKRFAKCYHYKPYEKYLIKYLSEENREIYDLLCECYDECVRDLKNFSYIQNEKKIVKNINMLKEKFNIKFEVYERRYDLCSYEHDIVKAKKLKLDHRKIIFDTHEYDICVHKDGYFLASSIFLRDNQRNFKDCFFAIDGKLYYGNSQWHNDVKRAVADEKDIYDEYIDTDKSEIYQDRIIFRYVTIGWSCWEDETVYYDNYKRCEQ